MMGTEREETLCSWCGLPIHKNEKHCIYNGEYICVPCLEDAIADYEKVLKIWKGALNDAK